MTSIRVYAASEGAVLVGLQRVFPVALAVAPISALFGALAHQADWALAEVILISAFGFTGSGQFAALPFTSESVGLFTLLLLTASLNCRYIPLAIASTDRLPKARISKAIAGHILGDEAFATERADDSVTVVLTIRFCIFASWILSGIAGYLMADILPIAEISEKLPLTFPASAVLLFLCVSQLKALTKKSAETKQSSYFLTFVAFSLAIFIALALISLIGPIFFWVPCIICLAIFFWWVDNT